MATLVQARCRLPKQLCARGRGPGQGKAPADTASWYVTPDIQLVPEELDFSTLASSLTKYLRCYQG